MKMEKIRTKRKPSGTGVPGECRSCTLNAPCGGYHVYVIELDADSNYDYYVGQTRKTVGQRRNDNWEKYSSQGNGPRLVRRHYLRMRIDLVPRDSVVSPSREEAEYLEAELADSLRDEGYTVRGPTNGRVA
jgi:hypothetical protein